nr:HAMP domain-containing sensor histidine kinase [Caulobacter ginsengisoli]
MADDRSLQEPAKPTIRRWLWPGGLSARLLLLTVLFVIVGAALVLPPALAAFEEQELLDRVRSAELATLATAAAPNRKVTRELSNRLLNGAEVVSVAVSSDGARSLVLQAPRSMPTPYLVDLRDQAPASWLAGPFQTLFGGPGRMVRVIAKPRLLDNIDFIEIVTPDAPLRAALLEYLGRLLAVTLFVSVLAGLAVYFSLNIFLVRPILKLTQAMERFRADPESPAARIAPSGRRDEIGRAERELDLMQTDLIAALNSRARLASLGEAVAKINHDLRNMLTSAQIASERLAAIGDPQVARAMPRLERALDRAITLATDVLTYGKTQEAAPEARPMALVPALTVAAEDAGLSTRGVRLRTAISEEAQVNADPDQLHRILVNLLRNAREAIEEAGRTTGEVAVTLVQHDGASLIRLADDGPGVPQRALAALFQPFTGSARRGGTGLGLAISRELAQAHGGDLELVKTGPQGSIFELRLPGAPEASAPEQRPKRVRKKTAEL